MAARVPYLTREDLAEADRLRHEDRHAGDDPLERPLQRHHLDIHLRLLPQHHVVLKVDRDLAVHRQVERRDDLPLDPERDAGALPLGHM